MGILNSYRLLHSYNNIKVLLLVKESMVNAQLVITIVGLSIFIILDCLHYAVADRGHKYYDNIIRDHRQTQFEQFRAYLVVISTVQIILCIVLFIDLFKVFLRQKIRFALHIVNLVFVFTFAVVVSLLASTSSIEKDVMPQYYDLKVYNNIAIADAVILWVLAVPLSAVLVGNEIDKSYPVPEGAHNPEVGRHPESNKEIKA